MLALKEKDRIWTAEAEKRILDKMKWVSQKSADKIPYTTRGGQHDDRSDSRRPWGMGDGINWWTNGFWGGIQWLLFQNTGYTRYAEIARGVEEKLDRCFEIYYGLHHDVGFMWLLTAVADYRLTGNSDSRRRGLHAANLLAGRFNPAGNFIRAWNECPFGDDATGWVIIDSMMNIPLLYWAWEETGDPRFRTIAVRHADTVMDGFFREDGSCCHIVEFDPSTGRRVRSHRGQGYAHGSAWSRGQAWAIYGFALSAMHTGETRYLEAARRAADYFIARIPENGLIPADFCQPDEPNWEDSAAAAIAACGLLSIAEQSGGQSGELYLSCALKLLGALYRKRCNWEMNCDCILENCTAAYHADEHHIHMIYGDYYFIEAVFRLCRTTRSLW